MLQPADARHHLVEGHLQLIAQQVHLLVDLRGWFLGRHLGRGGLGVVGVVGRRSVEELLEPLREVVG